MVGSFRDAYVVVGTVVLNSRPSKSGICPRSGSGVKDCPKVTEEDPMAGRQVPGIDRSTADKLLTRTRSVRKRLDLDRPVELEVVQECIDRGIPRVWLHQGAGPSSVTDEAVALCREHGIEVVDGACPMMFMDDATWLHRVHRWGREVTHHLTP